MGIPLRVLIVEDVDDDAELLVQELRSKGYDPLYERVDTEKAMEDALNRQTWDIVICDYSMPGFNAISALELMHKIQNDLPIILVSGTIGEEVAVEAMKAGAHDYIMKDNLSRFVPAIQRELVEYKKRCRARKVEDQLRKLHRAIEHSPSTVIITDTEGKIEYVNPRFSDITGYTAEEAMGKNPRIMNSGKQTQGFYKELWDTIKSGKEWHGEFCNKKKNGELYWESASISAVKNDKGIITNYVAVKEDITERRQMEDAIQTLVKGTVGVTGQEFFDRIVSSVCEWLGTDYAFVGRIVDGNKIKMLSTKVDKEIGCDCIHDITGTVCEHVIKEGYCVYAEGVSKLFLLNCKHLAKIKMEGYVGITLQDKNDKPIGVLWTASRHKLNLLPQTAEVMEIIAAKASAEIERMQMEDAIQALVKSTVGVTGQEFFDRVVSNMCEWLDTDCAFIGKISDESNVTALSMQLNGKITYDFSYSLTGELTPCGNVADKGFCAYTEGVCELFPDNKALMEMGAEGYIGISLRGKSDKPIGILWAVSRHKLNLPPRAGEVMDIIAAKAGSEIERMQAEEQIKKSLREKEVLLKEIHHRVKNNMQIVSSLLNLQSESIDDENIRQILKKSQDRVKSMALVHEKLYQTEDLSCIDFGEYTRSLTTRLLYSFGDKTHGVQLRIDIDEVYLDVNKAIPCGLIINEIVTNSMKHAFPDSTTGVDENKFEGKSVIKISMRRISDLGSRIAESEIRDPKSEIIKLVISDNGIGLPEGLDFRNTKTLGMELVTTLVGQLGGTIEYVNDGGAEFKITFRV